jgi:hypothetical protein
MKINNFFIFGNEYIDYLESEKNTRQLVWYEKLYIWYYNNFEYIIIIIGFAFLGFIFYNDYYVKHTTSYKLQSGGGTPEAPNTDTPAAAPAAAPVAADGESVAASDPATNKQENPVTNETKNQKPKQEKTENQELSNANKKEKEKDNQTNPDNKDNKDKKDGKDGKDGKSAGKSITKPVKTGAKFGKASYGKMKSMGSFAGSKITSAGSTLKNTFMSHTGDMYKLFFTVFLTFAIGVFILPTLVLAMLGFLTFLITKKHLTKLFTM